MALEARNQEIISKDIALQLGFNEAEWAKLFEGLGREPNESEFTFYFMLWSEAVSKKSSFNLTYPGKKLRIGEKMFSGTLDIGDGKVVGLGCGQENYVSGVSPIHGAEMALAWSINSLMKNGLRPSGFSSWLASGDVENSNATKRLNIWLKTLAKATNSLGKPLVSQQIKFSSRFYKYPILNVSALAVGNTSDVFIPTKQTKGSQLVYLGLPTGVEGLPRTDNPSAKPIIPVVDLFYQSQLFDALRGAINEGFIADFKVVEDGALVSALAMLAYEQKLGFSLELQSVPQSKEEMIPREILLSITPHRVLALIEKAKHRDAADFFSAAGIEFSTIGESIDSDDIEVNWNHKQLTEVPFRHVLEKVQAADYSLIDSPPMISNLEKPQIDAVSEIPKAGYFEDLWLDVLAEPSVVSKHIFSEEYDVSSGANTLQASSSGAAVLRLPQLEGSEVERAVALRSEALPDSICREAYNGAVRSASLAYGKVAATGARPVATCFNLNYGDFKRFENVSTYSESVKALIDTAGEWELEILDQSVKLSDDHHLEPFPHTSVVSVVGVIDSAEKYLPGVINSKEGSFLVIGETKSELSESAYSRHLEIEQEKLGFIPTVDFGLEKKMASVVSDLNKQNLISTASYLSSGGIAGEVTRSLTGGVKKLGAEIEIYAGDNRADVFLLSEGHGRYLISFPTDNLQTITEFLQEKNVTISAKGTLGGKEIKIIGNETFSIPIKTATKIWSSALRYILE